MATVGRNTAARSGIVAGNGAAKIEASGNNGGTAARAAARRSISPGGKRARSATPGSSTLMEVATTRGPARASSNGSKSGKRKPTAPKPAGRTKSR
jgi:hypothetical protein